MSTLITFTSGPRRESDPQPPAKYRFPDGQVHEAAHFAPALLAHLERAGLRPSRLLVLGTPNSAWENLADFVRRSAPGPDAEVAEICARLARRPNADGIPASDLSRLAEALGAALGLEVVLRTAENTGDSVFHGIASVLREGDRVLLDITHSFRSMPVHALIALGALRWIRRVELADVYYGALDEKRDGVAPARSLSETAALARATPGIARLDLEDDVGAVAAYLGATEPELEERLVETQRFESALLFGDARTPRRASVERLAIPRGDAASQSVAARTVEVLRSLDEGEGSRLLYNRARRALERRDFLRAIALAYEAIDLRIDEQEGVRARLHASGGKSRDADAGEGVYQAYKKQINAALSRHFKREGAPSCGEKPAKKAHGTLRSARNAVAHARPGEADGTTPGALQSEDGLRALLEWSFRFYDFLS